MKKFLLTALMLVASISVTFAQAKITFDKLTHNFGTFSEAKPVQKCTFTFTNTGDKPLIINQTTTSCGCTVAEYTKTPVKPGQQGTISVSMNMKGKFPGHFKKVISVYTNGKPEMTRLYIEGVMTEEKNPK